MKSGRPRNEFPDGNRRFEENDSSRRNPALEIPDCDLWRAEERLVTSDVERWERAKAVFSAALAVDIEGRERVLDELCVNDAVLRDDVGELLKAHDRTGLVDEVA